MAMTIDKLADETDRAYGRYVKELRRKGFAKKEQHYGNIPESDLPGQTAITLQRIYKASQLKLDRECADPAQPGLPVGEEWGDGAHNDGSNDLEDDSSTIEQQAAAMRETDHSGGRKKKGTHLEVVG